MLFVSHHRLKHVDFDSSCMYIKMTMVDKNYELDGSESFLKFIFHLE